MKVLRNALLSRLESVAMAVSASAGLEQSDHFAFSKGRVFTFNDEVFCSTRSELDLEGAVEAEKLLNLLRKMDEDEIEIGQSDGEVIIKGKDRRRAGIRLEAKITLPVEGVENPGEWHPLPAGFREAVQVCSSVVGRDRSRFILTCIHLHPEWIEATDQFQILRHPLATGLEKPTLVRCSAMADIAKSEVVEFAESAEWLHFRAKDGPTFSCRRYGQKFPELSRFLEVDGVEMKLPDELAAETSRASVFIEPEGSMTVELRPGRMRLTGRGQSGWYSKVSDCNYAGDSLKFLIAPKLLADIANRGQKVVVAEGRIKVATDGWTYVTCTGKADD